MKRVEQFGVEQSVQIESETTPDTQMEVDLICGGIGFDDGQPESVQWLKEVRKRLNTHIKAGGKGNVRD